MDSTEKNKEMYYLGKSQEEMERLMLQGPIYNPFTFQLLKEAGITAGMKVLDIGSGIGDVALQVAQQIGPTGHVVGVEANPIFAATASERASAAGFMNVHIHEGDINEITLDHDFDAVVGRFILMHLSDPVKTLHRVVNHVRSGGIVCFQESHNSASIGVSDPTHYPILTRQQQWVNEILQRRGAPSSMGLELPKVFLDAGLSRPQMTVTTPIGGGPDWLGYRWQAMRIHNLCLPLVLKFGLATSEEAGYDLETVSIDALEALIREEVLARGSAIMLTPAIGAWVRKA